MTNSLVFVVAGSKGDPYLVTFTRDGDNLTATCTCAAGHKGQYCKHRFALLDGDVTRLTSGNDADVVKLKDWLPGTDIERALTAVAEAEQALATAKRDLSARKKALASAFND